VYCPPCMHAPSHITYLQTSITPQRALGHRPVVLSWEVYKWPGYSYDANNRRHNGVIINNNHYIHVAFKHDLDVSALGRVDHQHSLQHERQAPAQEHHAPQVVTAATAPTNVQRTTLRLLHTATGASSHWHLQRRLQHAPQRSACTQMPATKLPPAQYRSTPHFI
jgi:hypothetical protein